MRSVMEALYRLRKCHRCCAWFSGRSCGILCVNELLFRQIHVLSKLGETIDSLRMQLLLYQMAGFVERSKRILKRFLGELYCVSAGGQSMKRNLFPFPNYGSDF